LTLKLYAKTALGNTGTPARHSQTQDKLDGRRPPSKGNSVKKKGGHKKKKRIVPDDIHVNINLVFVHKRKKKIYSRIERGKR